LEPEVSGVKPQASKKKVAVHCLDSFAMTVGRNRVRVQQTARSAPFFSTPSDNPPQFGHILNPSLSQSSDYVRLDVSANQSAEKSLTANVEQMRTNPFITEKIPLQATPPIRKSPQTLWEPTSSPEIFTASKSGVSIGELHRDRFPDIQFDEGKKTILQTEASSVGINSLTKTSSASMSMMNAGPKVTAFENRERLSGSDNKFDTGSRNQLSKVYTDRKLHDDLTSRSSEPVMKMGQVFAEEEQQRFANAELTRSKLLLAAEVELLREGQRMMVNQMSYQNQMKDSEVNNILIENQSLVRKISANHLELQKREAVLDDLSEKFKCQNENMQIFQHDNRRLQSELSYFQEQLQLRTEQICVLRDQLSMERFKTDEDIGRVTSEVTSHVSEIARARDEAQNTAKVLAVQVREAKSVIEQLRRNAVAQIEQLRSENTRLNLIISISEKEAESSSVLKNQMREVSRNSADLISRFQVLMQSNAELTKRCIIVDAEKESAKMAFSALLEDRKNLELKLNGVESALRIVKESEVEHLRVLSLRQVEIDSMKLQVENMRFEHNVCKGNLQSSIEVQKQYSVKLQMLTDENEALKNTLGCRSGDRSVQLSLQDLDFKFENVDNFRIRHPRKSELEQTALKMEQEVRELEGTNQELNEKLSVTRASLQVALSQIANKDHELDELKSIVATWMSPSPLLQHKSSAISDNIHIFNPKKEDQCLPDTCVENGILLPTELSSQLSEVPRFCDLEERKNVDEKVAECNSEVKVEETLQKMLNAAANRENMLAERVRDLEEQLQHEVGITSEDPLESLSLENVRDLPEQLHSAVDRAQDLEARYEQERGQRIEVHTSIRNYVSGMESGLVQAAAVCVRLRRSLGRSGAAAGSESETLVRVLETRLEDAGAACRIMRRQTGDADDIPAESDTAIENWAKKGLKALRKAELAATWDPQSPPIPSLPGAESGSASENHGKGRASNGSDRAGQDVDEGGDDSEAAGFPVQRQDEKYSSKNSSQDIARHPQRTVTSSRPYLHLQLKGKAREEQAAESGGEGSDGCSSLRSGDRRSQQHSDGNSSENGRAEEGGGPYTERSSENGSGSLTCSSHRRQCLSELRSALIARAAANEND
jgi:hypothetical protein